MSSQALLTAVETAGKDKLALLERETRERVAIILDDAKKTAVSRRQSACRDALRPLTTERAHQLHQARMTARKITAAARETVVARLLAQIEARLQTFRDQSDYEALFQQLLDEALRVLGEKELANGNRTAACLPRLVVDPRDKALAWKHLQARSLEIELVPEMESWGGVMLQSGDGLITVNNTLEARLEQLKPHLERFAVETTKVLPYPGIRK